VGHSIGGAQRRRNAFSRWFGQFAARLGDQAQVSADDAEWSTQFVGQQRQHSRQIVGHDLRYCSFPPFISSAYRPAVRQSGIIVPMLIKKAADMRESEATPKELSLRRREFLKVAGNTALAVTAAGAIGGVLTSSEADAQNPSAQKLQNLKKSAFNT